MNKKKISALIIGAIIVIVGIGLIAYMNKNPNIIKPETTSIASVNHTKKDGKIFNFDVITPKSKYINVRNAISNVVLVDTLKGYPNLDNPRAINAVKDIVTNIPDSLLDKWTHNGKYPIVKTSTKNDANSRFLHLYNDARTTLAYFTFNDSMGQVASQADNPITILSTTISNLKNSLAVLVAKDIIKQYPNFNENTVKEASLKAINSFPVADLYIWNDNSLKSDNLDNLDKKPENNLIVPVNINNQTIDLHLSSEAITTACGTYDPNFFNIKQ
ncbi:hypothetical protein [uncultured Clostridium sp.]|jgi:hypothetical protein|uniref:hypothetical protein n=1 Tax=uncultured Clostridium sp. TaxID=59620 RepID=UPI00261A39BD|nr:hypothetical protein [uncultured Clostridium sp.]